MSDFQPYEPDEPAQPPKGRVRLVMAAVLLLVAAVAAWGIGTLKGELTGGTAATVTRTVTATSTPPTTTARPTPSVQTATPVVRPPTTASPTTTATPTTPATTPKTTVTTTRPAVTLPGGARVCDGGSGVRSAAGTPKTSCSFAQSVRDAWVAAGQGDGSIRAHSSVTDQDYSMTCSGAPLTTCRGGNNAVVYLY